jgi:hypothetical protein
MEQCHGQVFWLVDRPTRHAFPSFVELGQWHLHVAFVPTHSGGATTDFHRLPLTQVLAFLFLHLLYNPEKFFCQHLFLRLLKS